MAGRTAEMFARMRSPVMTQRVLRTPRGMRDSCTKNRAEPLRGAKAHQSTKTAISIGGGRVDEDPGLPVHSVDALSDGSHSIPAVQGEVPDEQMGQ